MLFIAFSLNLGLIAGHNIPRGEVIAAMKRIPQLDGIRGIAILLVLLWHYVVILPSGNSGFQSFIKHALIFSWSGVDLFFVLSGFFIGGQLIDNISAKNLHAVFYYRRFLRIVPPYLIILIPFILISLAGIWQAQKGLSWLFKNPLPLWSYATFLQNYFMIKVKSIGPHWLGISWSLAIEAQFYLIIPFLIKYVPVRRLASILIISAIFFRLASIFILNSWYSAFLLLPCRIDSLILGVLASWIIRQTNILEKVREKISILYVVFSILGIGIFFSSFWGFGPGSTLFLTIGLTWVGVFYFLLILLSVVDENKMASKILGNKIFRGMGVCSYSIYLFHLIFLGLCHAIILNQNPQNKSIKDISVTLLALFLTISFAAISYFIVEKSLLNYRHKMKYG